MSAAIETLRANNFENFIAQKYIESVLTESAEKIFAAQEQLLQGDTTGMDQLLQTRSYNVSSGTLSLRNAINERFLDMKPRYRNQQQIPIHNKLIWTEFNVIAGKIAYGYTQAAKAAIAQNYKIDIHG